MNAPKRRRYSLEFKKEAVRRVITNHSSTHSVARELGISQPALSRWVRMYKEQGVSSLQQDSDSGLVALNRKLQRENKRLRDERDILKKATIFFANNEG